MADKKKKGSDLLDELASAATPVEKGSAAKKQKKLIIDLTNDKDFAEKVDSFCKADVVYKMAEGRKKASYALAQEGLKERFIRMWFEEKFRPDNPLVQTFASRCNFIVKDSLKINIPENGSVSETLANLGFSEEKAEKIEEDEFEETRTVSLRPFNELMGGDPSQRALADKLMTLVKENFSREELAALIVSEKKFKAKEGFLDRCVKYCDS